MKLLIATNNTHKAMEIRSILSPYFSEMVTLKEAGIVFEPIEDGSTFEENACIKAEETLAFAKGAFEAVLADDSGLAVDALKGAPGVHSARFAGDQHNDADNNAHLMACLKDVPEQARTAQFVCCIALARSGKETVTVLGKCHGRILFAPRGENGFGYDPYFLYEPRGKTFAELPSEEKNAISHRHLALMQLKDLLSHENCCLF